MAKVKKSTTKEKVVQQKVGSNANPITNCKEYLKKYEIRKNETLRTHQWKVGENYLPTDLGNLYIHLKENGIAIGKGDLKTILESNFVPTYQEPIIESEKQEYQEPYISPIGMIEKYLLTKYDFRYNEVRLTTEYKQKSQKEYQDFEPRDRSNLFIELKKNGYPITLTDLDALLESRDFAKDYHPFKLYFESLGKWNGEINYFEKLATYMKFIDEGEKKRFVHHLRKHFIRMIKQSLEKNYFNKQCFVFVGSQSDGKTYLTRWFSPDALGTKYYVEDLNPNDKDGLIALTQTLICNYDELARLSKTDINQLKSFFTKNTVNARHPYGRKMIDCKRHASFFGSTNNMQFLNDPTGSVRWLCFVLEGKIDWQGYTKDMKVDDLWKQAYHAYKQGATHDLTKEEEEENEVINQRHLFDNDAVNFITKIYRQGTAENHHEFMTATDISLFLEKTVLRKIPSETIGRALTQLKYIRKCKRIDGEPVQGYYMLVASKIEKPKPTQDLSRAKEFVKSFGIGKYSLLSVKIQYNNIHSPFITDEEMIATVVELLSEQGDSKRFELSADSQYITVLTPF